jgi:hypothetical protein
MQASTIICSETCLNVASIGVVVGGVLLDNDEEDVEEVDEVNVDGDTEN